MCERRIKITYDIVTPESAEYGDFAECGWENEEGEIVAPDDYDIDEHGDESAAAVALALDIIGRCVEASNYPRWSPGTWYTDCDAHNDYTTDGEYRRSYHLEGFSEEEERNIYAKLV